MSLAEGASTRQPNPVDPASSNFGGPEIPRKGLARRLDLHVLRALMPFLWTANSLELRLRVVAALALLCVSTLATVYVPMIYKMAIDALTAKTDVPLAISLPVGIIVGYGMLRFPRRGLGRIARRAVRQGDATRRAPRRL